MFKSFNWGTVILKNVVSVAARKKSTVIRSKGSTEHYQIAIKFSGKTKIDYNNKSFIFGAGDVVFIPKEKEKNVPDYREIVESGNGICIFFDSIEPLYDNFTVFHCGDSVKNDFILINQLYNDANNINKIACMQTFYRILSYLEHETEVNDGSMKNVLKYIEEHFCDTFIDISVLAEIDGTNKDYFRQKFKSRFGIPPLKYINGLKLQFAKSLLSNGTLTVAEVAEKTGFSDANYFTRFFKKNVGVSPNVYKNEFNIIG